jgi:hypothetical protein
MRHSNKCGLLYFGIASGPDQALRRRTLGAPAFFDCLLWLAKAFGLIVAGLYWKRCESPRLLIGQNS